MRKIIDANCLTNPLLEEYLQSSLDNIIVLIEFAGMEMYKGDPLKNICHSMKILCQYPSQVIVLKGARQIIRENQTPKILNVELFIDKDQTEHFPEFCEVIKQVENENPNAIAPIMEYGNKAAAEMQRLYQVLIPALFPEPFLLYFLQKMTRRIKKSHSISVSEVNRENIFA